jgi:hypothetical protein
MQRFVALMALVAAFLAPLASEVTCAMGTFAVHCCCDRQNGLEALPDRPALQSEMTCCPHGECAISAAPTVGKTTDATEGTPSPSVVAATPDAAPALDRAVPPWIEPAAIGRSHDPRGPPVPMFLLHRTLLV